MSNNRQEREDPSKVLVVREDMEAFLALKASKEISNKAQVGNPLATSLSSLSLSLGEEVELEAEQDNNSNNRRVMMLR